MVIRTPLILLLAAGLLTPLPTLADGELYVLITPEERAGGASSGKLRCEVGPETEPPTVKNAALRLRVRVAGVTGMVRWRVPLFAGRNGDNDLAVSRVGEVRNGKDFTFTIDLNTSDLERTGDRERLVVEVSTRDGLEGSCSTKAEPLYRAARNAPEKDLGVVTGAVTR